MRVRSTCLSFLTCISMAAPAAVQAQTHFILSPTIGAYIPTTELVQAASGQKFKQEIGLAVGLRAALLFGERFGVTATGSYVPSDLHVTFDSTGAEQKAKANLWFGSARASFYLIPPTKPFYAGVNGGVALIGRGGKAYEGADNNKTDVGGVVGALVGFRLGSLGLYLAADDYIYHPSVVQTATGGVPSDELTIKNQNDIHVLLGLGVPIGH